MTKSELVARLAAEAPDLTVRELERAVNTIIEEISAQLERGGKAELRGFGTFDVRAVKARWVRNPRTQTVFWVEKSYRPWFRAGKHLRDRINHDD